MKVDWSECDNERVVLFRDCKPGDKIVFNNAAKCVLWLVVSGPDASVGVVALNGDDTTVQDAKLDAPVTRYQARVVVEKRL